VGTFLSVSENVFKLGGKLISGQEYQRVSEF
jgi:hypothetical protein